MSRPIRWLLLCIALVLAPWLPPSASLAKEQLLSFTDLHFSPFSEPSLTPYLAELPGEAWDAFLSRYAAPALPAPNQAANYALFESLLADASSRVPRPRFILFSGDLLAHHFNRTFGEIFPEATEQDLEDFITATVEFIIDKVADSFPQIPVLFTLGNNDAFAGDYALIDGGQFLQRTAAPFFDGWLRLESAPESFFDTYLRHGYYSTTLPYQPNTKLISLSSVVFSPHYPWEDAEAVASAQLDWVEAELAQAAAARHRVWMLLHIPPSADVYASLWAGETRMQWRSPSLERLLQLLRDYGDHIVFAQSGHTHMDDFRLIFADDRQLASRAFVHITPSISPIFGNNPAYQVYEYEPQTAEVVDITTYYLDLQDPLCGGVGCQWRSEYRFTNAYGNKPDLLGFESFYRWIPFDRSDRSGYVKRYSVSISPPAIQDQWSAFWCGIAALTAADFERRCGALYLE